MAFVGQDGLNNCGGFAMAYWVWMALNGRHPNDGPQYNDAAMANNIYQQIIFRENDMGMPEEFSDPRKMIEMLRRDFGMSGTVLHTANRALYNLFIGHFNPADVIADFPERNTLPDLAPGQYAILIVGPDENSPTHYVLVQGTCDGVNVIDPANGVLVYYHGINIGDLYVGNPGLVNTQTAIYINP
ncbi:MAG: hypothetical protein K6D38_07615 [Pseudobutyrivibrio sp.]|nr:hypothetical protein [Pseudobutyrivibrio sp.]